MYRKLTTACFGLTLFGLSSLGATAPAHAALIHNFIDTSAGNTVIGQIEFSAATPGTVTAFSLDTTASGGPILGLANLCGPGGAATCLDVGNTTTWSIDGAWNLNGFVLAVNLFDFFSTPADVELEFNFISPASSGTGVVFVSGSCVPVVACLDYAQAASDMATVAVHEAPEPATALLFAAGLTLLAGMAREKSRKQLA